MNPWLKRREDKLNRHKWVSTFCLEDIKKCSVLPHVSCGFVKKVGFDSLELKFDRLAAAQEVQDFSHKYQSGFGTNTVYDWTGEVVVYEHDDGNYIPIESWPVAFVTLVSFKSDAPHFGVNPTLVDLVISSPYIDSIKSKYIQ